MVGTCSATAPTKDAAPACGLVVVRVVVGIGTTTPATRATTTAVGVEQKERVEQKGAKGQATVEQDTLNVVICRGGIDKQICEIIGSPKARDAS